MISLDQLKQRKIFRWAAAYLAGAWLLMQLGQWLADVYTWPAIILRALPVVLGVGFLVLLVLAWYHGESGRQRVSGAELALIAGVLLMGAIGLSLVRPKTGSTGEATVEQGSIAVLPFSDLSAAKDQTYFSDGLAEELLNVLAKIPQLRVAARTSAFSFREKNIPIDSIGRALRVEYVLEGSVRTAGDKVRIAAQLIKAADGFNVWSNTYERDLHDIFAVQQEISNAIVDALRLRIAGGTIPVAQRDSTDPETHALVLRAMYAINQRGEANIKSAVALAKQAIARDSAYAPAWTALAYGQWYTSYRRWGPVDEGYRQSAASARHALELNPNSADAHVVLGRIADVHEWDFKKADEHFARARELRPNLADAYVLHAWLLMRLGKTKESLESARHGALLDPVSAASQNTLASMYAYADDYPRAIDAYRVALALRGNTGDAVISSNLALVFASAGVSDSAIHYAVHATTLEPEDPFALSALGYAYGRSGKTAEAEAVLRKLQRVEDTSPYNVAVIYVSLGRHEEAIRELERAIERHDDLMPDVGVDDVFRPIQSDPRIKALLRKMGLPPRAEGERT